MIIHRSNRTEALLDGLVELVATPPDDPFVQETIAVQGAGMARWLSLQLAQRLRIWANPAFPFLRALIDRASAAVLDDPPAAADRYAPDALLWAVAAELPRHLETAPFASLRGYLDGEDRDRKRLQLAARVADLFDQYAVFRPEMVLAWDRGGNDGAGTEPWQPLLWRSLVARLGPDHPAARARRLLDALARGRQPTASFPRRLSVFGLSTLAPLYVRILGALSAAVEVHLFVLTPTGEYWSDLMSPRQAQRLRARTGDAAHVAAGHPLLGSLGKVGREFADVIEDVGAYQERDAYLPAPGASALATLQNDMLAVCARGSGPDEEVPVELSPGDASIAIHACHGPMREIEVLRDQLVERFEADPSLQPHDVVVMTPSIDAYAPLIAAVFSGPDGSAVPYHITDRGARATDEVLDAFLRAIEVLRGRLKATAVLDLLSFEPVRARAGIAAEDLETVRIWVREANVRWGVDEAHREEEGQPADDLNTWRFGLDRLLVGYALAPMGDTLFAGTRPIDAAEGAEAALLGRLAAFVDTLARLRVALRDARPLATWRVDLATALADLVAQSAENSGEHEAITAALEDLARRAASVGFADPVDLDDLRRVIEQDLQTRRAARGFATGAVTFCELVPMRSIPFRVVCLVGLNDGAFPRTRRALSFDLMATHPRPGDRSRREDDRYLFLEAILSARDHLIITYVGQRSSDNGQVPPSVVVSELGDAIDRTFLPRDGQAASALMTRRHPLQAFSRRYFTGDAQLFSYSARACRAAQALAQARERAGAEPQPFFAGRLEEERPDILELDELIRFFDNPSRGFLRNSLGLYLPEQADAIEDREPITLDVLGQWHVGDAVVQGTLAGRERAAVERRLRAEGRLPLGTPGGCALEAIAPLATEIGVAARRALADRGGRRELSLEVAGLRLAGVLHQVGPHGLVAAQYSKLGGYHELRFWIRHLALAASGGEARESRLFGRHAKVGTAGFGCSRFGAVAEPLRVLADLVDLYRRGRSAPLPFFPQASRAYAEAARDGGSAEGLRAAAAKLAGGYMGRPGDAADPYVAELYPDGVRLEEGSALRAAFEDTALRVYGPLLDARQEAE